MDFALDALTQKITSRLELTDNVRAHRSPVDERLFQIHYFCYTG